MLDAWASEPHYLDHLAPIWAALGAPGTFWGPEQLRPHAASRGVQLTPAGSPEGSGPIMVASYRDEKRAPGRPIVFVEHGAGQDYGGGNPAHPGGRGRDRVILFICPSESVADRNRAVYPQAAVAVVGCPKLDRWTTTPVQGPAPGSAVALSFHWEAQTVPESRSAFPHYLRALPWLRDRYEILGHGHPRAWTMLRNRYRRAGIEPVEDLEEVFERAGLLLFDNSSAGYEFAAIGRPVVVLNAPWYRRDVEHGLRFWELAGVGPQVEGPEELEAAIESARNPRWEKRREAISRQIYAYRDGRSAERAADAIRGVVESDA